MFCDLLWDSFGFTFTYAATVGCGGALLHFVWLFAYRRLLVIFGLVTLVCCCLFCLLLAVGLF